MPSPLGPVSGRTFAAVLFDMDGTLVDSTAAVERSWLRWADDEGLAPEVLAGTHGVPAMGIVQRVLPPERWESAHERICAIELADVEGIVLLPGAAEALRAVATTPGPARSAIATSCTRALAQARIAASGLEQPDVVVTADDVERGKPDPQPYLLAATRLGVAPQDCLVVEDAPQGLTSARAAGCATLAVTTTTPGETLARDPAADAVVGTLADVRFVTSPQGVTLQYVGA